MHKQTAIERAFAIARSGRFSSMSQIAHALRKEGYSHSEERQLVGASLARQLRQTALEARKAGGDAQG